MNELRLIGDIGGTNARFALARNGATGRVRRSAQASLMKRIYRPEEPVS